MRATQVWGVTLQKYLGIEAFTDSLEPLIRRAFYVDEEAAKTRNSYVLNALAFHRTFHCLGAKHPGRTSRALSFNFNSIFLRKPPIR